MYYMWMVWAVIPNQLGLNDSDRTLSFNYRLPVQYCGGEGDEEVPWSEPLCH